MSAPIPADPRCLLAGADPDLYAAWSRRSCCRPSLLLVVQAQRLRFVVKERQLVLDGPLVHPLPPRISAHCLAQECRGNERRLLVHQLLFPSLLVAEGHGQLSRVIPLRDIAFQGR